MTFREQSDAYQADLSTVSDLYLRQCAGEAIHLAGTVQPHGFTLVVNILSGRIVQASTGVTRHLPGVHSVQDVLGSALAQWVSADSLACAGDLGQLPTDSLQPLALQWRAGDGSGPGSAAAVECSGHRVGPHVVLECIVCRQADADALAQGRLGLQLNRALTRLRRADQLPAYFDDCVAELQGLCGYDRVMLYRFLPDFSGEVVAEHCADGVSQKYLGMRFPASDIPAQARQLYETNTLRILADVQAQPDALLPTLLPDATPLDQSHCLLRSLSQAHLVYLRNIGVRATLTISILRDGRLWGLIACHHSLPRVPPAHLREAMREVCELMANVISMRIDSMIKVEEARQQAHFSLVLSELGQALAKADNLAAGLHGRLDRLRQAFAADDFGLRLGNIEQVESARARGMSAPGQTLDQVAALLAGAAPGELRTFDNLRTAAQQHLLPGLAQAAGLLVVRLPQGQDGFCFFTRPELVTQVRWAGQPNTVTVVTEADRVRLEARRSFEVWQQEVVGCATPWSAAEQAAAQRLARLLSDVYASQGYRELQRQLEWRSRHDELTGLLNRKAIEFELDQRLHNSQRAQALLVINIDHFKRINPAHGQAAGDEVLRHVATQLKEATRGHDLLARLGSDEFMVLTEVGSVPTQSAEAIAERLRSAVNAPLDLGSLTIRLDVSMGMAVFPKHGRDAANLLRRATMALHEARARGRQRCVVFDDSIESTRLHSDNLEDELRTAIAEQQLRLHYQPKVDLRSMKVVSLEALVRWQHPRRGLLGPLEFIALAEQCRLIQPLGRWVMNEAAAQVARWQAAGLAGWPVAVNVSFVQIISGSVVHDLSDCFSRHRIAPSMLELELTESVMMENTQQTIAMMNSVADMGVKVSLDDFGTGYSSLAYVRQLPLDSLKIDRSFVMNLESEPSSQVVTRGIIGLASGLNLATIAEGIETAWQLDWLQRNGCDVGQGYLFGKPVPAAELPALVVSIGSRFGT